MLGHQQLHSLTLCYGVDCVYRQGNDRQGQSVGRALVAPKHLYTCTVSRKRSQARYYLPESSDVVDLLAGMAAATHNLTSEGWLRKPGMKSSGSTFF